MSKFASWLFSFSLLLSLSGIFATGFALLQLGRLTGRLLFCGVLLFLRLFSDSSIGSSNFRGGVAGGLCSKH
jgi:hypothetical protein